MSSIIAGATSPEQARANAAAVGWQLTADDLGEIDRLATTHAARSPTAPHGAGRKYVLTPPPR